MERIIGYLGALRNNDMVQVAPNDEYDGERIVESQHSQRVCMCGPSLFGPATTTLLRRKASHSMHVKFVLSKSQHPNGLHILGQGQHQPTQRPLVEQQMDRSSCWDPGKT